MLVLSDGIAGHDRASEGIVAALARRRPVAARWLAIEEVRPRSRRIARIAAALGDPARFLAAHVRLAPRRLAPRFLPLAAEGWPERADVVVSTGPSTAAANIAAARRYGGRSIYFGFPKVPVLGFAVLLSPVPSASPRVALTPRPTTMDATALPPARPLAEDGPRTVALLFGGETKHYAYTGADMDALAAAIRGILAARPHWTVTAYDSRRTRADLFDRLAAALCDLAPRFKPVRYETAGTGSNAPAFEADLALVTADSLSMIDEALAAARPTLILSADRYRGPKRDRREIAVLTRSGAASACRIGALDLEALLATPRPPHLSRPEALARLLAERGF